MAIITGTNGNDELFGTDSTDSIDGGAGNDTISGGAGDDILMGGAGDDLIIQSGSGTQHYDGGSGVDTYGLNTDFTGGNAYRLQVDLSTGISGLADDLENPLNDTLENIENIDFSNVTWDLALIGDSGDNVLKGGGGTDSIDGGAGNDTISGGAGDDILMGGAGDDLIIQSGSGTQHYDGGSGVDTYGLNTDFTGGNAYRLQVDLSTGISGLADDLENPLNDTLENIENIDFSNVTWDLALIGDSGDNVLKGGSGTDSIDGGAGNDTISGGADIDMAIFSGVRSSYTITTQDGVLKVKDNLGTDGTDTLTNIEKLQFADATWDVTDLVFDEETDVEGTVQENTEGADVFTGTAGIDKVVYNNVRADIDVSVQDGVVRISNGDVTDELTDIERISFIDTSIALDIDGNAGSTAKILGAVFGKAALANKAYAGIGLSLLDSGEYTYESLMDYALTAAGAQSNEQVVELLYTNAVGVVPTTQQVQAFVALLDDGTYTRASLGALAAEYAVSSVTLAGLAETGLEYTPFG